MCSVFAQTKDIMGPLSAIVSEQSSQRNVEKTIFSKQIGEDLEASKLPAGNT